MSRKSFLCDVFVMIVILLNCQIFCDLLKDESKSLEQCFQENYRKIETTFGINTRHNKKGIKGVKDQNTFRRGFMLPSSMTFIEDKLIKSNTDKVQSGRKVKSNRTGKSVFLSENCTTVVAQIGTTAVLHCEVIDITENTVSWIRRKDYSLLSVGLITYSADSRFFVQHQRHMKDWSLNIRGVNIMDYGFYECQVPTHPPKHLIYKLVLIEAYAEILGEPEKLIHENSTIRLSCVVRNITEYPQYVFWYFQNRMINYDTDGVRVLFNGDRSILSIENASMKRHSGKYTCSPANAKPTSSIVHIVHSETPAAMKRENSDAISIQHIPCSFYMVLSLFYFYCVMFYS